MWNISVFAAAGDPTSLFESMEWDRLKKPFKELTHMRGCVRLENSWEHKFIIFCLLPEEATLLSVLIDTFNQFEDCRHGIRPLDEKEEEESNCPGESEKMNNCESGACYAPAGDAPKVEPPHFK